jgi:hypothetical protein
MKRIATLMVALVMLVNTGTGYVSAYDTAIDETQTDIVETILSDAYVPADTDIDNSQGIIAVDVLSDIHVPDGMNYDIRILTRIDNALQHDSRNTYIVEFQARTRNGAVIDNTWDCQLAYDTSIFELVSLDGARNLEDAGISLAPGDTYVQIPLVQNFSRSFSQWWSPRLFAAFSENSRIGYVSMQGMTIISDPNEFPEFTTLQEIRFAFRPGKTVVDANADSIRFVRASEMQGLGGVTQQVLISDGTIKYLFGRRSGEPNTLSTPIFILDDMWDETIIVSSTTHPNGPHINLTDETIHLGNVNVMAYSTDGGIRWRRGSLPTGAAFSRLLNRDMTLFIATELDSKRKATGTFIEFPMIRRNTRVRSSSPGRAFTANPTAARYNPIWTPERIGLWYGEETWNITKRNTNIPAENTYIFAKSTNGRTPDDGESWRTVRNGMCNVLIGEPETKVQYIFRLPPVGDGSAENPYMAASRAIRIRPLAITRAPHYSIDFRSNSIRMRRGDVFTIGDGDVQQYTGTPLNISDIQAGTVITVWRAATGRRPPSAKQTIVVPW